jgi:uncharacterized membrane protein YphA (DoxX/SURF4 family)
MSAFPFAIVLQVIIAAGLLNVWLIRAGWATSYRGGGARSLREEFAEYGLGKLMFYAVGVLKVGAALLLLVGIWIDELVAPAAALVVVLMLGALAMHIKIKDPPKKSLPAFLMFLMSAALLALALL